MSDVSSRARRGRDTSSGAPPEHWLFVDVAYRRSGVCHVIRADGCAVPWQCVVVAGLDAGRWRDAMHLRGAPSPSLVVIEYPYLDKGNVDTAIKLGRAVGFVEAVARLFEADVDLVRASSWQKHLGAAGVTRKVAKARVRSVVRGLATHPSRRARVRGRFDRVWLPGLEGVGMTKGDQDRADAAGGAIGYAIGRGWELPVAEADEG